MDYKKLLEKYMWHIGECEGTDFLSQLPNFPNLFTKEEVEELDKISGDIPDSFED